MTDIKTVLTDEAIAAVASSLGYDQTLTSGRRFKFARAIEAAVLAASAPAQEPFKWCLRIVRPQEHNYATNDLYNTKAEAEAARVHASKFHNNVSVFPLYAAPVDAQDAVDRTDK